MLFQDIDRRRWIIAAINKGIVVSVQIVGPDDGEDRIADAAANLQESQRWGAVARGGRNN